MILTTPEIVWHNKEPIFSVDFHRNNDMWRLATAGADHTIRIWKVTKEDGRDKFKMLFLSSLERHTKAVNAVRFAPDGSLLASGGDDCVICLWKLSVGKETGNLVHDEDSLEHWTATRMLRGHVEDVYDMCWSSDSRHLISGSVDNTAIVWNTQTGEKLSVLSDSRHYIQGVAWDPAGVMLATLSSDRTMRVYGSRSDGFKCLHNVSRCAPTDENSGVKQLKMFLDETISSFFRRLAFSPDGSLLVAPGGRIEGEENGGGGGGKTTPVVWIFTKTSLPKPVLYLPGPGKPSLVVRFCPVLFELRKDCPQPSLIGLPYRMVFAVATQDKVLLYDTQQHSPIALVADIHYTSLTDLAWSSDGLVLAVTSSDGYCSLIGFESGELGEPLQQDKLPVCIQQTSSSSTCLSPTPEKTSSIAHKTQSATSSPVNVIIPRRIRPAPVQPEPVRVFEHSSLEHPQSPPPPPPQQPEDTKKPRRIQLVPLENTSAVPRLVDTKVSAPLHGSAGEPGAVQNCSTSLTTKQVQPTPVSQAKTSCDPSFVISGSSSVGNTSLATKELCVSTDKAPRRVPFVTLSSASPAGTGSKPPLNTSFGAVAVNGGGGPAVEAMDVE